MRRMLTRLLLTLTASLAMAPVFADCVLRQSDAIELQLGPFVDSTDGVTAETALTIAQADVRLSKCTAAGDCGAWAQANEATSAAHGENGWYEKDFDATDTNTVGILMIAVNESGALPVFKECLVVETAVYDALYADAVTAINVNVASTSTDAITATSLAADTIGASELAAAAIGDSELNVTGSEFTSIPDVDTLLEALVGLGAEQTADSGTTTTIVDAALTQADTNWFAGQRVHFTSGTLLGQTSCVESFTPASDTLTINAVTAAVGTHTYYLLPDARCGDLWRLDEDTTALDINGTTLGTVTTATNVTTVNGLAANTLTAAAAAADLTTELQAGLATAAALDTVDNFLDTEIADILTDTGTTLDDLVDDLESRLGTPSDLGGGATVAANLSDIEGFADNLPSDPADDSDIDAQLATLTEALIVLGAEQTADSGTTTTIVDAALTQATNDWFKGAGVHFTSGTLAGQDACVSGFTAASDTLTFAPAVTTAVTTHNYYLLPNAECQSTSGSGASAADVWSYVTRELTALDEDTTTLDLNATSVNVGSVTDGAFVAADFGSDFITAAKVAADVSTELLSGLAGLAVNTTQISGDSTAADNFEALLDLVVNVGNGALPAFGISASGTAQTYTAGTPSVTLAGSTAAADNDFNDQTITVWGDEGELLSACISDYTGATDVATIDAALPTAPTGTIRYIVYPTPTCGAAAGSLTANDVWTHATRTLTALDEDVTTLDLNATAVGSLTTFDEDSTTIDINATTLGTVTTATNVTTVNGLAANTLTAAAAAADLTTELQSGLATASALTTVDDFVDDLESRLGTPTNLGGGSATVAGNLQDIEAQTDDIGVAGAGLTNIDLPNQTMDITGTLSTVTTVNGFGNDALVAADIAADVATELQSGLATAAALTTVDNEIALLLNARTQILPAADADGILTADSGDTNTLVDTELTFSNDVDIDGAYVVRSDGQRCFVDSFTAATDTIEFGACAFTGAWSTQTYKIYPANTQ